GTPTSLGFYSFAVAATDASGQTVLKTLSIFVDNPIAITTTTLTDALLFQFYGGCISTSNGQGTRTFSVMAGTLPSGLTLQSNGCLANSPTATGTFNFTVQVTDSSSPPQTATSALALNVWALDQ